MQNMQIPLYLFDLNLKLLKLINHLLDIKDFDKFDNYSENK